jgi:hypothetical protein
MCGESKENYISDCRLLSRVMEGLWGLILKYHVHGGSCLGEGHAQYSSTYREEKAVLWRVIYRYIGPCFLVTCTDGMVVFFVLHVLDM